MKSPSNLMRKMCFNLTRLFLLLSIPMGLSSASATLTISEFLAKNDGGLRDEDGQSPDWIEIHNSGPEDVALGGWHLTDDPAALTKWTFPATNLTAGSFMVVLASGKNRTNAGWPWHANFQLSNDQDYLALVQPDETTVVHAYAPAYPNQRANVSYGLNESGALRYFVSPTPGASNGTGYLGITAKPQFSIERGFYSTPFTVAITSTTAGAAIYWTTNGSAPSLHNGTLYTNPVLISGTTLLRAAAFLTNYVPSISETHTYLFLNQVLQQSSNPPGYPAIWQGNYPGDYGMDSNVVNHPSYGLTISNDLRSIPTLSLVSEHDSFWHPTNGIYVDATVEDEERAASAELFNGDGASQFQINCAVQMQGNASRDNVRVAKHSFRLQFKGEYGPSKLEYNWFPGPVNEFDNIVLRACFTDSWATRDNITRYRAEDALYLRDVWVKECMRDMGHLSGRGSFVHLYVNGLYWGLYNPTERLDDSYFALHLGGYDKDWDVWRDFSELLSGDPTDWNNLMTLVNAGITNEASYQLVAQQVDIDNLIDYMLLHIYIESEDWPSHNWYAAHRRANATNGLPATRWIFLPWDQEVSVYPAGTYAKNKINVNNTNTPARIYSQLRNWPEFRVRFGDRTQKHLGHAGALAATNSVARLQALAARIQQAMVGESARWGDAREFTITPTLGHGQTFTRDEWWVPELDFLCTNYLPSLNETTLARLRAGNLYSTNSPPQFNQFGGSVTNGFKLVITHTNTIGTIYFTLDGTDPRVYGTGAVAPTAQFYSAPISINAPTLVRARVLRSAGNWSALVEATFYPPQDLSKLVLTEIMYHPPDIGATNGNTLEFLELKNTGTNSLNLSGLTFTSGITFAFTNGTVLGPGQFFVMARNASVFAARYPGVAVHGAYTGQLDNSGEALALAHTFGTPVFSLVFDDRPPWPVTPDVADFSLVPRSPNPSRTSDQGSHWRASTYPGGSPGTDDPSPVIAPIVISEILAHTDLPEKDSIELYNPTATNVNIGGWFLTDEPDTPMKFRIPNDAFIAAGGWVVFDEDDFNPAPGTGGSFSLSSTGDDVHLFSAALNGKLTGYGHSVNFGASFNGVSFGRQVNSAGEEFYPRQAALSLGTTNAGHHIGPVVISEIHYHPAANGDEFIELHNVTGFPVPLFSLAFPTNTWKFTGVDYAFPTNLTLDAHAILLVVATNPASFRAKYDVPANVLIFGPYTGTLLDSGENVELQAPDNPNPGVVPYVVMDGVLYDNQSPWPPGADGGGMSLQRAPAAEFGHEPTNWIAAIPTPGQAENNRDTDGDGVPDGWEQEHGTSLSVHDSEADPDGDGLTNGQEHQAGTHPLNAASALQFSQATIHPDVVALQFLAASNRTYSVLSKTDLSEAEWSKLSDHPAHPTNRLLHVTHPVSPASARFYRLVTPAQTD